MSTPGPRTAAWQSLEAHAQRLAGWHLRAGFAADPARPQRFSAEAAGLVLDYSRQRLDEGALADLLALADAVDLRGRIEAMWRGEHVNVTEDRAALHVALRRPDAPAAVLGERARMLDFAERVRRGDIRGSAIRDGGAPPAGGGEPFALVVNIGIGGSDLGPAMAVEALRGWAAEENRRGPRCAFVSNVDGCDLADALEGADPARTLFIVASKTFTTLETLTNARTARAWIAQALGEQAVPAHFAAVSVNARAMDEFGVHPEYRFAMWDWVGGRYSLWSSIGVSLAIALGREGFEAFLRGGHEIDEHFRSAPWAGNLPALMALLGVWNVNFLELPTLAVLPYDARLRRFPAYLQQLEMESNGKSATLAGEPVAWATAPVIWGEPGSNAQHSFFQLLHQGTPRAALDFLLPARSSCGNQPQQDLAIANCLAQAEAFAFGQPQAESRHKVYEGNRPGSIVLFEKLDPATLGRLVALYEHKVYAQSVIWGVNAFDQWGVELGKKLAAQLVPAVQGAGRGEAPAEGVSAGVEALLGRLAEWRRQARQRGSEKQLSGP